LRKEFIKKKKNLKESNEELVKTRSQESETKVDEKPELKDLPDLVPLFEQFDAKYFKGILKKNNVKVTYSKRLLISCGVCCNESVMAFL
jgi:hypothetical protein